LHRCRTPLTQIGRFEPGDGRVWVEDDGGRRPLDRRGYDHLGM
jgi:thiamine monophosphate kinase